MWIKNNNMYFKLSHKLYQPFMSAFPTPQYWDQLGFNIISIPVSIVLIPLNCPSAPCSYTQSVDEVTFLTSDFFFFLPWTWIKVSSVSKLQSLKSRLVVLLIINKPLWIILQLHPALPAFRVQHIASSRSVLLLLCTRKGQVSSRLTPLPSSHLAATQTYSKYINP